MKTILFFLFISLIGFSQNRTSSVAMQIEYGIYSYFEDSLGITPRETATDCDCVYTVKSTFWTFINNKERKSPTLDTDILDWLDEDHFVKKIESINKESISKFKGMTKTVYLTVDIERRWIVPNPIGMDWKIRYDYTITIYLDR